MSRSYRKVSISGITMAESEKKDKRLYNRRYRKAVKQSILAARYDRIPILRECSNPWSMDKDGKQYFNKYEDPKGMRK